MGTDITNFYILYIKGSNIKIFAKKIFAVVEKNYVKRQINTSREI